MPTITDPLFPSQWHFPLLGDIQTIWNEYSGAGVHVGIYDDGVEYSHEDLAANYDPTRHVVDNLGNVVDPFPLPGEPHGTSVAGLIAGALNGLGGVGVSWGASITGVNIFADTVYGYVNAGDINPFLHVVRQAGALFDISSNSWGAAPFYDASQGLHGGGFSDLLEDEYATLSYYGRGGLGTVIVQAAGNNDMDGNGDGTNASRFTITVAATDAAGDVAYYSNFGSSILIAAPAAGVTTDRTGADGYDPTQYTIDFGGTSAATPVTSGVIALMLDANSGLGWRDVQNILAMSATLTGSAFDATVAGAEEEGLWQANNATNWNGGGNHIHTNYGYGMLNAYNAVRMAEVWHLFDAPQTSANESGYYYSNSFDPVAVPDNDPAGLTFNLDLAFDDVEVESVALMLDLTTTYVGDLRILLTSPQGTTITVALESGVSTHVDGLWQWGIEGLRGEAAVGTWTLQVIDTAALDITTLRSIQLVINGPGHDANDTYHFTDEFLAMKGFDPDRGAITDSNGGVDWLNLAAVTGDVNMTMDFGVPFTVDGVEWATLNGTFEHVVTGDGNDTLIGNGLGNQIHGMRGADLLGGADGSDSVYGGTGNDTLSGDAGLDSVLGGTGDDTYLFRFNFSQEDRISESGGSGVDVLSVLNDAAIDLLYRRSGADLIIEKLGFADKAVLRNVFSGLATDRIEKLLATDGERWLKTTLAGTSSADIVVGASASEVVTGGGGNDIVVGGGGHDSLFGNAGIDKAMGGAGDDFYNFAFATDGNDTFSEIAGSGFDSVVISDRAANALLYSRVGDDLLITQTGSLASITVESQFSPIGTPRIENLTATDGLWYLKTTLAGTSTNDIIVGSTAGEALTGGGGRDIMSGGGGGDTLTGNADNDTLMGGLGDDTYVFTFSTDGLDTISELGGGGGDTLDITNRTIENLSLRRSGGSLVVFDGSVAGQLTVSTQFSGVATERVELLTTTDRTRVIKSGLVGTATSDVIVGSSAAETLQGFDGLDVLAGGGGKDRLEGGTGADLFMFADLTDSSAASAGRDTIMDFLQGTDRISLRGIDANSVIAGNQTFVFQGTGPHSGAASLRYSIIGGNTLVEGDVGGDGISDFSILLAGVVNLAATDFIL